MGIGISLKSDVIMPGILKKSHLYDFHGTLPSIKQDENTSRKRLYLAGKRSFDILASLFIILFILSWLVPVLAILIKLDSGGPVFFLQRRVGFMGRTFRCLKFRTMVVNKDCDLQQARENDPRITRLGRFLRVTSLDELPQFINVLVGDMSIVGPRPFMHKDNDAFRQVVFNYNFRFYARPGITGMAQVKGFRGPTVTLQSIFHRYQWDAFYVRNACPSLDMRIIRLTARQILKSIFYFKPAVRSDRQLSGRSFVLENAQ
jgi:putative colanic acid biosynthesis UDP-glucose lipid carrier transferase